MNRQGTRLGLVEDKFKSYEKIANEFNKHIEALKTHCLTTDLHLESALPLQVASISYEVCSSLVKKKDYYKFRNNFKKRIDDLEKNFQRCSDPTILDNESLYRKNYYELPADYLVPKAWANDSDEDSKPKKKNKLGTTINDLHNENTDAVIENAKEEQNAVKAKTDKQIVPKTLAAQLYKTLQLRQPIDENLTI